MKQAILIALAASASVPLGCVECPKTSVPLGQLVAEYNANAAKVPSLWARARVTVKLKGVTVLDSGTPNGLLLLFKGKSKTGPHDFVLVGKEGPAELFRAGSSTIDGKYYFWGNFAGRGEARWGRNELAGAPGVEGMPIDPNQLLAVLSVCELPDDLTQPPTVAMTMNAEPGKCAYVVTYVDRQPVSNRILFRREVLFHWDDEKPRRPFRVNFFDTEGRRVLTAELKNYAPVKTADDEAGQPPLMPTDVLVEWIDPTTHEKPASVRLRLSKMDATGRGAREACVFDPPVGIPVIQVDRNMPVRDGAP